MITAEVQGINPHDLHNVLSGTTVHVRGVLDNSVNVLVKSLPPPDVWDEGWNRAGTLASAIVALFTGALAWSTRNLSIKTSELAREQGDLMRSEDKRHQQGYAPLLRPKGFEVEGNTFILTVENVGIGMAKNISLNMVIDWQSRNQSYAPIMDAILTHNLSVIPAPPYDISTLRVPMADFPLNYDHTSPPKRIHFKYEDMFGNPYESINDEPQKTTNFQWIWPEKLR
jgi:hypothetical protein